MIFFTSLFACEHKNIRGAYLEYKESKQNYIEALLDHDKLSQIFYLRKVVTCGHILDFDVRKYQKVLNKKLPSLEDFNINFAKKHHSKIIKKEIKQPKKAKFQNPLKIESNYVKLLTTSPIKLKLSSKMRVKYTYFNMNKHYYIFNITNAKLKEIIVKNFLHLIIK